MQCDRYTVRSGMWTVNSASDDKTVQSAPPTSTVLNTEQDALITVTSVMDPDPHSRIRTGNADTDPGAWKLSNIYE
jgi:hypothetical protein